MLAMKLILAVSMLALMAFAMAPVRGETAASEPRTLNFKVYDNMFYRGKPDTAREGLVASNIVYENHIWPEGRNLGTLADRAAFEQIVRAHSANPGPLVLDIEKLPVKGAPDIARRNMETLARLADWARDAVRGKPVGFYGTNTLSKVPAASFPYARELARHVDAFFPPMYTFDDDRLEWANRAKAAAAEAHDLGPGKPVYFYLWPQYHDGTPKAFQYVDSAYWEFQLQTAARYANGLVLWSPSRYDWNDSTGWWRTTREFMRSLREN